MTARGLIVGAARSGSGKTSVAVGLMRAFRRRGLRVAGAKSGPDYIDPGFHAAATGRPGVNLDSWAMPPPLLGHLLQAQGADADLLVVESAMGLFDGVRVETGRSGSAADIARHYGLPVLLVLDISGQSQTAAVLAHGFATFDPGVRVAGVVLNQVASPRHEAQARAAIAERGIPVLGAVPRNPDMTLPERHLGLVQAREHAGLEAFIERLADVMAAALDLDAILSCAQVPDNPWAGRSLGGGLLPSPLPPHPAAATFCPRGEERHHPVLSKFPSVAGAGENQAAGALPPSGRRWRQPDEGGRAGAPCALPPPGNRIAVAEDDAFTFLYPHLAKAWRAAGVAFVPFSPLADEAPDDSCDACWLPGGYPELHAGRLAAAENFFRGLARFAQTRPVHGECGGFMVLGQALEDASGRMHRMTGLLGHATSFAQRRMNLGYRQAKLLADSPLGEAGRTVRGHEFHYSRVIDAGHDAPLAELSDATGKALGFSGSRRGHVSGTFFHAIAAA